MIKLMQFRESDFDTLISWIDRKELLVQIAGNVFSYPLTIDQLERYLNDKKSFSFNIVDVPENKVIGHAEIYLSDEVSCKLDKILIGDKTNRGKGLCQQVISELLEYSFVKLGVKKVELNVYDWNIAGIRCYEKAGFIENKDKRFSMQVDGNEWMAINMTIDMSTWIDQKN
jgi:RimJ/RimL family protein N-acetyltransferase